MDAKELFSKILPCDTERPYAFVSYSHRDGAYVWEDVLALQKKGYNIWIDRTVDPTEERSWDEKTKKVITSINCKLVIFYTSKDSVISNPCMNEICACHHEEAARIHNGKPIPILKIDAEVIQDVVAFKDQSHQRLEYELRLSEETRTQKAQAHGVIFQMCFSQGNKTVRMLNRADPSREIDYYQQIEEELVKKRVEKRTPDEIYKTCFNLLGDKTAHAGAVRQLTLQAENWHVYSTLLLSYLYRSGLCVGKNTEEADQLLGVGSLMMAEDQWYPDGKKLLSSGEPEKAAALLLGHAMNAKDPKAFVEVCGILMKKKNRAAYYDFAKDCLDRAAKLGSEDAAKLSKGLEIKKRNNRL